MPIIEGAKARVPLISGAGAPTANVTGLGLARMGDTYLNTTSGTLYVVTATDKTTTIAWAVVGAQAGP
jgi:uncharacterized Zn-binding protein involved in type VI secretion